MEVNKSSRNAGTSCSEKYHPSYLMEQHEVTRRALLKSNSPIGFCMIFLLKSKYDGYFKKYNHRVDYSWLTFFKAGALSFSVTCSALVSADFFGFSIILVLI